MDEQTYKKCGIDEQTYKRWWSLQMRSVNGEPLSSEEQAEYQAGMKILDDHEMRILEPIRGRIRQIRLGIRSLMEENKRLHARRIELEKA